MASTLVSLAEDVGLVPITHMVAHNHLLTSVLWDPMPSSDLCRDAHGPHTLLAGKTFIYIKQINLKNKRI